MPGLLIVLDGCDGAGKTTFAKLIEQHLWDKIGAERVLSVQQPGATQVGQGLRRILKDSKSNIDPKSERMLFAADYSLFVNTIAKPELAAGKVIVSDRFGPITDLAYGIPAGTDFDYVTSLHHLVDPLMIDLLLIFKCPWEIAKQRKTQRNDQTACRIESRGDEYMSAVAAQYEQIKAKALASPDDPSVRRIPPYVFVERHQTLNDVAQSRCRSIVIIDATRSWDEMRADCFYAVGNLLAETNFK